MRYELSDHKWDAINPMLPNKPRGIPRADDRRVLNGIFWVLRSGAPWRDLPEIYGHRTTWLQPLRSLAAGGRMQVEDGKVSQDRLLPTWDLVQNKRRKRAETANQRWQRSK